MVEDQNVVFATLKGAKDGSAIIVINKINTNTSHQKTGETENPFKFGGAKECCY